MIISIKCINNSYTDNIYEITEKKSKKAMEILDWELEFQETNRNKNFKISTSSI